MPKSFDNATGYEQEIRLLVPGYDALHTILPAMLGSMLPTADARVLVIGCGPAHETVAIARELDDCFIDALDPSRAMIDAARTTIRDAGLERRIRVHQAAAADFPVTEPYDAVLALLVGHFIPDDGSRAAFLATISAALRPAGVAILAELEDAGAARPALTTAHLRCSRGLGVPDDRLDTMRERLTTGFHAITRERLTTLANQANMRVELEFFRSFGVVGLALVEDSG